MDTNILDGVESDGGVSLNIFQTVSYICMS